MQKKNIYLILVAVMMVSMMLSIIPVNAWIDDGTTRYEKFGPRAKKLLIKLYSDDTAEFAALENGEIDICDWPLSKTVYDEIQTSYPNVNITNYGAEYGLFILDINSNNNEYLGNPPDPEYPNPVYPNPTSDVWLRRAIAYLIDRDGYIADPAIGAGFGYPMYTTMPVPNAKYLLDIYGNTTAAWAWQYNPAAANATLDEHGFPIGSDGWRYWDRNGNGVKDDGEDLILKFYIRSDHPGRLMIGQKLLTELESVRIQVDAHFASSGTCFVDVMVEKDFNLYTGGWSLGVTPDHLILWSWNYYWHPGFCYNYGGHNVPEFNEAADGIMYSNTQDEAVYWAMQAQWYQAYYVLGIPIYCVSGNKGSSYTYVGPETPYHGVPWTGIGNSPGYGIDNGYTFLNMHPVGYPTGPNMTIRYGFKVPEIKQLNPIYASWLFDWNVLGLIYFDSLLATEQYDPSALYPWLASEYTLDTYEHPTYGTCSRATFTLRPDVYWSDGTPLTVADIYFTYVELKHILESRGLPPPWWWSNVQDILSFSILDPYRFEVLLDVKSYWALFWVNSYILPKHIWKPIAESGDPQTAQPDPDLIGMGPWKFGEYVSYSHVLLYSNDQYWRINPCLPAIVGLSSKADAGTYSFDVTVDNMLQTSSMTVDKTVKIDGVVVASDSGVSIAAGATHTETITHTFGYGLHNVTVTVDYTAGSFSGTITIVKYVWIVIKEDIGGSTWYDVAGYSSYPYKDELGAPDCKVDLKDVFAAALAFGSFPGHSAWNTNADLNGDHKIDLKDYFAIATNFGWTCGS